MCRLGISCCHIPFRLEPGSGGAAGILTIRFDERQSKSLTT
jgi:hypothetical protein